MTRRKRTAIDLKPVQTKTICFLCAEPLDYAPHAAPKYAKCRACTAAEHDSEVRDEAERERREREGDL